MRAIAALASFFVLGLAACSSDSFTASADASVESGSGLEAGADGPGADGPITDAGGKGFCEQQSNDYLFCDDFDTAGDGATGLNAAWQLRTKGGGTATRVSTRFHSPKFALEATSLGGASGGGLYRDPNAASAKKASLAFAAFIDPGCVDAGTAVVLPAIAGIPVANGGYYLALVMSGPTVAFAELASAPTIDGGTQSASNVIPGVTAWPTGTWVRVVLDLDFPAKKAALSLDGALVENPALTLASVNGVALPGVSLGTSTDAPRVKGCTVTYDDVVFRITK